MSKKIKRIICCVCASLVLIVALCLPFAFNSNTNSTNFVSADEVVASDYSFNGSGYPVTFTGDVFSYNASVDTWNSYNYNALGTLRINFYNSGGSVFCNFVLSDIVIVYNSVPRSSLTFTGSFTSPTYKLTDVDTSLSVRFDVRSNLYFFMSVKVSMPIGYSPDISSFSIGSRADSDLQTSVVFTYYNSSSTSCSFAVAFYSAYGFTLTALDYDTRIYYLSTSLSDNQYYSAGYDDGVSAGYADGNTAGYSTGYNAGDTAGYNRGYNAGVADSNDYSFIGLIGAVIDAPISAFTGLFNFEILGVNISGFLLGLFTLCVVIVVVRKLLL